MSNRLFGPDGDDELTPISAAIDCLHAIARTLASDVVNGKSPNANMGIALSAACMASAEIIRVESAVNDQMVEFINESIMSGFDTDRALDLLGRWKKERHYS